MGESCQHASEHGRHEHVGKVAEEGGFCHHRRAHDSAKAPATGASRSHLRARNFPSINVDGGEAMSVVTIAMSTMIANSVGVMMPRCRPKSRMVGSVLMIARGLTMWRAECQHSI